MPPVGEKVWFHLASSASWVSSRVVGYYVWNAPLPIDPTYSRVYIRMVDEYGVKNARLIKDIHRQDPSLEGDSHG